MGKLENGIQRGRPSHTVLTYAAPIWFSGHAGLPDQLKDQLRKVQNAAVRPTLLRRLQHHPYRTAPPSDGRIDLRLRLPIKNVALRLYRLPSNSQLKARVPGPWGTPRNGLIPLPILLPRRPYRSNLLSLG